MQNPVIGLLIGGLAAMSVLVILSAVVWAWAVRRPAPEPPAASTTPVPEAEAPASPTPEPRPMTYAAIGASDVVGTGADDPTSESWINVLHGMMPKGTELVRLGRGGITLGEANRIEVPEAVEAGPDIVTIWNVVNDATRGVTLTTYLNDLTAALDKLTNETQAQIVVLNMPDITVVMNGLPAEQKDLIRGGVEQWNRAIAETAARYGDRVRVVDLYPISEEVLNHPEYISPDNFHPSSTGYRRLAEVVWDEIRRDGLLNQ